MRTGRPAPAGATALRSHAEWRTTRRTIDLNRPVVMGILNITPDSFFDGGRYFDLRAATGRLEELAAEGADVIDIGGESTRPGSNPVSADEELRRVVPAVEAAARLDIPVSIDTTKAVVARAALDAGAETINDISGLRFEPGLAELAADRGAGLVLMHLRGVPRTMQDEISYDDVLAEVGAELGESVERALSAGCRPETIVIDPGIGFGKTAEQNVELIARLDRLAALGYPVLIGPSRKSFIGAMLDLPVDQRVEATIASCVMGLMRGARIFRVHDVAAVRRALDMADLLAQRL